MSDDSDRTFRLGDRVTFRVASAHKFAQPFGDVIGMTDAAYHGDVIVKVEKSVLVGWADGSQSWELPIELRLAAER